MKFTYTKIIEVKTYVWLFDLYHCAIFAYMNNIPDKVDLAPIKIILTV